MRWVFGMVARDSKEAVMDKDFIGRFRAARDKGLASREAYKKRDSRPSSDSLHFSKPLEYLTGEDWEEILLRAAESGWTNASLEAKHSCSGDDAFALFCRYKDAYLTPLQKEGALGQVAGQLYKGSVHFFVWLYGDDERPPYTGPDMSEEEFEAELKRMGLEPDQDYFSPRAEN